MRNTKEIRFEEDGRDKGKCFEITEMSAFHAHDWALSAFSALASSGVQIPDEVVRLGMEGLPFIGLQRLLSVPEDLRNPLLDKLRSCIQIIPDPSKPHIKRALLVGTESDDLEEWASYFKLYQEVVALHVDFSVVENLLIWVRQRLEMIGFSATPT